MRELILYSAMSLDGFIATETGSLDWLFELAGDLDYGYTEFMETVDTTLMGRATYDWVLDSEGPDVEIYPGKKNYVFSHIARPATQHVEFTTEEPAKFARRLKETTGSGIWLVGGGKLNEAMFRADLVDTLHLDVVPVLLGSGIPLSRHGVRRDFELLGSKTFPTGVVEVRYTRKR